MSGTINLLRVAAMGKMKRWSAPIPGSQILILGCLRNASPSAKQRCADPMPKIPVSNSATANSVTGAKYLLLESFPPIKLPSPRPSMKPLSTMVTDSVLSPQWQTALFARRFDKSEQEIQSRKTGGECR
jgi:hypothetical protein